MDLYWKQGLTGGHWVHVEARMHLKLQFCLFRLVTGLHLVVRITNWGLVSYIEALTQSKWTGTLLEIRLLVLDSLQMTKQIDNNKTQSPEVFD